MPVVKGWHSFRVKHVHDEIYSMGVIEIKLHKVVLALALSVGMTISPLCQILASADNTVIFSDEYRYTVQNNLEDASAALSKAVSGDYGMLYEARNLIKYGAFTAYAVQYSGSGSGKIYTDKEAEYFTRYLAVYISQFNTLFGEKSDKYHAFRLKILAEDADKNDVVSYVNQYLFSMDKGSILKHIDSIYAEVLKDLKTSGNDAAAIKEYNVLCKNLYNVVNVAEEVCTDLDSIADSSLSSGKISLKVNTLRNSVQKISTTYSELYEIGEELSNAESINDMIGVDDTKKDLENLATLSVSDDGIIRADTDPTLSINYLAIMAAGSVYTPFSSYVGDDIFVSALKSLVVDESEAAKLVQLYNNNKSLKKPLYRRKLDKAGLPTGVAELITLSDFKQEIESGEPGALVAIKGDFVYSSADGAWLYRPETKNLATRDVDSDVLVRNGMELEVNTTDALQGSSSQALAPDETTDPTEVTPGSPEGTDSTSEEGTTLGFSLTDQLFGENIVYATSTSVLEEIQGSVSEITGTGSSGVSEEVLNKATEDLENMGTGIGSTSDDTETGTGQSNGTTGVVSPLETNNSVVDTTKAIYAYEQVSMEDRMTGPVLLYGATYAREVDNTTTALMHNIFSSVKLSTYIADSSTEYLYMNPFGDIVTEDDLVILPGCANPLLYQNTGTYNPFTVAFMNSYPSVLNNTSYFQVAAKEDIGKYLMFLQTESTENDIIDVNEDSRVKTVDQEAMSSAIAEFNTGNTSNSHLAASQLSSICNVKSTAPLKIMPMETNFIANSYDEYNVLGVKRLIFGRDDDWSEKNPLFTYTPLVIHNQITVNGRSVFPYKLTSDIDRSIAAVIADNMLQFLTVDRVTSEIGNAGKLNDNWIIHYVLINGTEGTNNASGYVSGMMFQYQRYAKDADNRFVTRLTGLSESLLNGVTSVDGVVGLKNVYEDSILGTVLLWIQQYWLFALLAFILILMISFAKFKRDLFQTCFVFVIATVSAIAFVVLVPVYLPLAYNVFLNNMSDQFSYKLLAQKAECYDAKDDSGVKLDKDGNQEFSSGSITLYRLPTTSMQRTYRLWSIPTKDATNGKINVLNQESGTFVQGDSVKINSDMLFKTLEIDGAVQPTENYQLTSHKTVSNNVDYYTPYYQIVDGFIDKLNRLSQIYAIPESVQSYGSGKAKNNYLVYCYLNSQPFLNDGDDYSYEMPVDTTGWSEDEIEEYSKVNDATCLKLTEAFGKNADWLGISQLLFYDAVEDTKYQNTLWFNTLLQNRYYYYETNENGASKLVVNKERMETLVTYVNYQTRRFVLGMENQTGVLSDDVMIKIIALRALIAFNQKASEFSNWLYPFCINYPEFTLDDILVCTFVNNYADYVAADMNLVEYIKNEYGWFHLIVFDLLTVLLFVVTYVSKTLVAVMYLGLAAVVLLRMARTGEIHVPIKGYLKCTGVVMGCSMILCFSVTLLQRWNYNVIVLYALLLILLLVVYLLTAVVSALFTNFMDLGENTLTAKLAGSSGVIRTARSRFSHVNIGRAGVQRRRRFRNAPRYRGGYGHRTYNRYEFDDYVIADPEDAYSGEFGELFSDEDIENL